MPQQDNSFVWLIVLGVAGYLLYSRNSISGTPTTPPVGGLPTFDITTPHFAPLLMELGQQTIMLTPPGGTVEYSANILQVVARDANGAQLVTAKAVGETIIKWSESSAPLRVFSIGVEVRAPYSFEGDEILVPLPVGHWYTPPPPK